MSRLKSAFKPGPALALLCCLLPGPGSGCASEPEVYSYQSVRAHVLNEVGLKSYREGDLETALANFQRALHFAETSDHRPEAVRAHVNIGQILVEQDRWEEGSAHFDEALKIARDLGDDGILFNALEAVGKHRFREEKHGEAESLLQEALEIAKDLESREKQAMALNDLGAVYKETGRTGEALDRLHHALMLYGTLEGRASLEGRGSVCNNLAAIRQDQERYADAWDLLTSSLACYQQLGDPVALVTCHANMANLLEAWGKKSDALIRYERAYSVAKEIPHPRWMEISLQRILYLTQELGMEHLHQEYTKIFKAFWAKYRKKIIPP